MTPLLLEHLSTLDHGRLADLVGDARIVELVEEISRARGDEFDRGSLILDILGGAAEILEDRGRRTKLVMSLDTKTETALKRALDVKNAYTFKLTDERRSSLYRFFGFTPLERSTTLPMPGARGGSADFRLFPYQVDALHKCAPYLDALGGSCMLHMPTGAGKTRTAMHLVARHLNSRPGGVVLWIVSGIELCIYAAEKFEEAWRSLGNRPLPVVRLWGKTSGVDVDSFARAVSDTTWDLHPARFEHALWPHDLDDGFVAASVDTLTSQLAQWEPGEINKRAQKVSLIVFDEAHRAIAETYKSAVESLRGRAGLLGLSATPGRRHHGGDESEDAKLAAFFGGNRVVLEIPPYESPVEALIDQGYLANLVRERLEVAGPKLERSDMKRLRERLAASFEIDEATLTHIGLDATRNLQIIARAEKLAKQEGHRRIIVFAPSVESSNLIANLLRGRGVSAISVTNKTPMPQREAAVRDYLSSAPECRVLCNYGILTTGFDAPQTSAVLIGRPTNSIVLLSQMAGRATRGAKVGGNKTATLVTVVDTSVPELVNTVDQFHAFDGAWQPKRRGAT